MRRLVLIGFTLVLSLAADWTWALSSSTHIMVPAAARVGTWVTDLYLANPNDEYVTVTVYWLERGQANLDSQVVYIGLQPGQTRVLDDVILATFGHQTGTGAFRIRATRKIIVNSRIFSHDEDQTFGQGFEGVPEQMAVGSGQTSIVIGLCDVEGSFRTNFYALSTVHGAALDIELVDADGISLASQSLSLGGYEPFLERITNVFGVTGVENGMLKVTVTSGRAVFGASKIDDISNDPMTLESTVETSPSGSWEFSLYDDSQFATGGSLYISQQNAVSVTGSFLNRDKDEDDDGKPDCQHIFMWGAGLPDTDLAAFANGVVFTETHESGGEMQWTLELFMADNVYFWGQLTALGSGFPSSIEPAEDMTGCNGHFPPLTIRGGRQPWTSVPK